MSQINTNNKSEQKDRKFFTQVQLDEVYIKQGAMCAGSNCTNSIAFGFQAHHKDKDHSNNKTENCQLLCIVCHTKTFSDNPLKAHNDLVRLFMQYREDAIKSTLGGTMKGTDLERVLAGIEQQKSDSWKVNGLSNMFLYPSANISMQRILIENNQIQEAMMKGYEAGIKAVTKTLREQ